MSSKLDSIIKMAFDEDLDNKGDITTDALFDDSDIGEAKFICEEDGVLSGIDVVRRCFYLYDKTAVFSALKTDSDIVKKGDVIAEVKGRIKSLFVVERVALNFLAHLSGIASTTKKYVEEIKNTDTKLKDTRKTTPVLRQLEKEAVKHGGGENHRFGLYDGILVKDNHLKHKDLVQTISLLKKKYPDKDIEIEVETIKQVNLALEAGADILLLDNMSIKMLKKAQQLCEGKALTEASGQIKLDNIKNVALTGVNFISTSAITMAAKPLSIKFE